MRRLEAVRIRKGTLDPDEDALVLCDMMLDNGQTGLVNRNLTQTQAVKCDVNLKKNSLGLSPSKNDDLMKPLAAAPMSPLLKNDNEWQGE